MCFDYLRVNEEGPTSKSKEGDKICFNSPFQTVREYILPSLFLCQLTMVTSMHNSNSV